MKAIILAAGQGKRFGKTTITKPKPLIKLGNLSLIEHNILLLKSYGFTEIVINVSYLANLIIDYLGNGDKYNVKITYSIEYPEPLETGGGIHNALSILGKDPFLVINSDIYTDCNLSLINLHHHDLASLVMVKNPPDNLKGDFSISNGRITLDKENMMTYSGIGIYNPKIFKNIEISKYKLINILLKEIKNNRVSGIIHKNIWYDIGDNKKLKKVSNLFF